MDTTIPCDACHMAKATVEVMKDQMRLDFCTHHFNQIEPTLIGGDWVITRDDRDTD